MESIYSLKNGDKIQIVDYTCVLQGRYSVERIIESVAICRNDNGEKLYLPMYVPMPFAVKICGEETAKPITARTEETTVIEPAEAAEQKAEENKETAANEQIPDEKKTEEGSAEAQDETAEQKENIVLAGVGEKHCGRLSFFHNTGKWGKISHPTFKKCIFFHISQVTDEALKEQLDALKAGDRWPELVLQYVVAKNTHRIGQVLADQVEIAPEGTEVPAIPKVEKQQMEGYVTSFSGQRGKIMVDSVEHQYIFSLRNVKDPELRKVLEENAVSGAIDAKNIKVSFATTGKYADDVAIYTDAATEAASTETEATALETTATGKNEPVSE